jgi:lysophospholipase L1-like esterase
VVAQTSVVTPDGNYNQLLGATWPNFNLVLPGTDTEVGNAGITVSAFNNTRAGHALSNTSDPVAFGWRLGAASGTLGTWLNERKSVDSDMTTSASSAAGGFWIGNNSVLTSVYYFKGKVSEVILYNRALTDVEVRSVNRYLVEKYRLNQTDLILDGDSITLGTKSTWGHSLQTLLYKQNLGLKIVDIGVGGRGSTGRLATMAKWAPAQRASSEPILYMVGTNDINGTGTSAIPLLESNVMAYGTNAHLYNKRLIISTIPSIKTLSHDEDNAAQIYNAWVRANWKSFADGLCDYGSIPQVGALGANASGTYFYSDGIHPLPAGYDLMAPVATDALRELYGLQISSHLVASGTATAYPTDSTVIVTGTAGATIVLPLATTPRNGKTLTIKDGGGMALVNNIAISGTVNGSAASPIITNYGSITIMTDGTNWFSR